MPRPKATKFKTKNQLKFQAPPEFEIVTSSSGAGGRLGLSWDDVEKERNKT